MVAYKTIVDNLLETKNYKGTMYEIYCLIISIWSANIFAFISYPLLFYNEIFCDSVNAKRSECFEFVKRQVCKAIILKEHYFWDNGKTSSVKNWVVG